MDGIKFAVVREDPLTEEKVIKKFGCKRLLMIASGGCSALSLQGRFPDAHFALFDTNPKQIELVQSKLKSLKNFNSKSYKDFNIGVDSTQGLNSCGEFESLFRSFRHFIYEFILPPKDMKKIFLEHKDTASSLLQKLTQHRYWGVAFDLFFSNSILVTMFGEDAVQHAPPHSYPGYFRGVLEAGLQDPDFQNNYFLHHILLGHYLQKQSSWPPYLLNPNIKGDFSYINEPLLNINIESYDFIGLSNIFDWMNEATVKLHLEYIEANAQEGAVVVYRQLNNTKNYHLEKYGLAAHLDLERNLIEKDRSLFYNRINIATKTGGS